MYVSARACTYTRVRVSRCDRSICHMRLVAPPLTFVSLCCSEYSAVVLHSFVLLCASEQIRSDRIQQHVDIRTTTRHDQHAVATDVAHSVTNGTSVVPVPRTSTRHHHTRTTARTNANQNQATDGTYLVSRRHRDMKLLSALIKCLGCSYTILLQRVYIAC